MRFLAGTMEKDNGNYIIALLIDTDNVSAKYIKALMKELIVLGKVSYKRMYGDFAKNSAEGLRNIVNEFSIIPVQQYTFTSGKNVTDSRMIIEAMDILYSGNINAMCIMSSDSDFTGLAKRLRVSNIYVIGAGEKKTPNSFVKACDRFFVLEDLIDKEPTPAPVSKGEPKKEAAKPVEESNADETAKEISKKEIEDFVSKILEDVDGKPCALNIIMQKIYQAYPQFNYKQYGAKKAMDFFSKTKYNIRRSKNVVLISLKA